MTPIKNVRPATDEDLKKKNRSKYGDAAEEIINLLNQGQQAVVDIDLEKDETEMGYRSGISAALIRKGVEKPRISKIESGDDKKLVLRVGKER